MFLTRLASSTSGGQKMDFRTMPHKKMARYV